MDSEIKRIAEDMLNIRVTEDYQFKKTCGFTFVFKKMECFINERISSAEIKPIAIIYEENGEYYLAPIDVVDEIDEVIKEFVRQKLQ